MTGAHLPQFNGGVFHTAAAPITENVASAEGDGVGSVLALPRGCVVEPVVAHVRGERGERGVKIGAVRAAVGVIPTGCTVKGI